MSTPLLHRLRDAHALARAGDHPGAFALLQTLRDEALAATDKVEKATFLQCWAAALDRAGSAAEALESTREALILDKQIEPLGQGVFLTLHSMTIILKNLGRLDEAAACLAELLSVAEHRGALELAGAADLAHTLAVARGDATPARPLLERARFRCEAALREEAPDDVGRYELTRCFCRVALALARIYTKAGDHARAERVLGPTLLLVAAYPTSMPMRQLGCCSSPNRSVRPAEAESLQISWCARRDDA